MLDSIFLIGENNRDNWLEKFIKSVKDDGKEKVAINIIFDLDNNDVSFELKRFDEQVAKKYRYINKTFRAARESTPRLTFESKELSNSGKLKEIIDNVIHKAEEIKDRIDMDEIKYITELENILGQIKSFLDLEQIRGKIEQEIKKANAKFTIECYTISIKKGDNYKELATENSYTKLLEAYIKYPVELNEEGLCYMCRKKRVLIDPAFESGSLLKVYNVDKKGFMSGIADEEESKIRTFTICPECRLNLIIGSKYVTNNLVLPIKSYNMYVIPRISFAKYDNRLIKDLVDKIIKSITIYDKFAKLQNMIKNLDEFSNEWYTFTIIFGSREQAAFSLEYFVQEVPITNIRRIYETMCKITNEAVEYWNDERGKWDITLSGIAQLYPFKNGKEVERRPLIELLASILQLSPYPINKLFEIATLWSRITYYNKDIQKKKGFKNNDLELVSGLVKFNYILLLIKRLGMIAQTSNSGSGDIPINDEHIRKWVKQMQYDELQAGLFMLGYLISQVGHAQFKKGDEKKSILDKIDFKGMKREKIITLANEMPQHLRNYRILNKYNEVHYSNMMELINKNYSRLDEDPTSNLFYILSGYAYGTYKTMKGSIEDMGNKDINNSEEE